MHKTPTGLSWEESEKEIYQHILSRNPEHDFEPTLDRVQDVCAALGDPQLVYKVVHIAGTNGKTSTARMTQSLLQEQGLRTGLFTSPHLTSVRERIIIDGEPIGQQAFVELWQEVAPIIHLVDAKHEAAGGPKLSFFEVLTVLALAAFADAPVDVAVIEVGMGGGWDSTNVVNADVAVITPIALDHQDWLGDNIADIAAEKAGIIKANSAVVVGKQSETAAAVLSHVIAKAGSDCDCGNDHADNGYGLDGLCDAGAAFGLESAENEAVTAFWAGQDLEVVQHLSAVGGQLVTLRTATAVYEEIFIPLYGAHQADNALCALTAVELIVGAGKPKVLSAEVVEQGFAKVKSPGRLELVRSSPTILVDAAHNPAGVAVLADAIRENFSFTFLVGVVGILGDKDAEGVLGELEPFVDHLVITASNSPRAIPADKLAVLAAEIFGEDRVSLAEKLPDALDMAAGLAESTVDIGGGVLVTGSITVIAEARLLLRADEESRRINRRG